MTPVHTQQDARYFLVRMLTVAVVVYLSGCGSGATPDGRTVVKGRIVENGSPFVPDPAKLKLPKGTSLPPGTNLLQVTFIPKTGGENVPAIVNPNDGSFTVSGADGKGIKPGVYKIAVTANAGPGTADLLGGRFGPDNTPIEREVRPGDEVVIDVAKAKG
jgi:hypothetical protein